MARQRPNVERMRILGATVVPAVSGSKTLKDATNEAMRHWINNPTDTHYIIGSVVGPHPYPDMVARFRHITIPMLSPTLFFVLITTLIGAFQVFDVAFVLGGSRGGGGNLLFYLLNLWNEGFRNGRYGYASALAVVFVACAAVVVIVAMRLSERFVYYEGDDRG